MIIIVVLFVLSHDAAINCLWSLHFEWCLPKFALVVMLSLRICDRDDLDVDCWPVSKVFLPILVFGVARELQRHMDRLMDDLDGVFVGSHHFVDICLGSDCSVLWLNRFHGRYFLRRFAGR